RPRAPRPPRQTSCGENFCDCPLQSARLDGAATYALHRPELIVGTVTGPASPEESRAASGLELLRTNRDFRRLWLARAISFVGDSLGLIALLLYTANATGDAFAVALLLVAGDLVPSIASPLTGALSDRVDRRALMVGCELFRGAVVTIIAAGRPN